MTTWSESLLRWNVSIQVHLKRNQEHKSKRVWRSIWSAGHQDSSILVLKVSLSFIPFYLFINIVTFCVKKIKKRQNTLMMTFFRNPSRWHLKKGGVLFPPSGSSPISNVNELCPSETATGDSVGPFLAHFDSRWHSFFSGERVKKIN